MSGSPFAIRNYRSDDFDAFLRLNFEAEEEDGTGRYLSPRALSEYLRRPKYLPERDLFIAELDGSVIGCLDMTPEVGIGRVVLDCLVHPEHRGKGVATELMHHALRRAADLEARLAHANIAQDNLAARRLLEKLGFGMIRRYLELRLQMSEVRLPGADDLPHSWHHLSHGQEEELTEIQNRAFAGSWGFNPNTVEDITYRINLSGSSPSDIILATEGDKVLGYCWTTADERGETGVGGYKGRIHMIGVTPECRGKGVGRTVLLAGLFHLRSKGAEVVVLTVDSENRAAGALYESVGFKISATTVWYEKKLV